MDEREIIIEPFHGQWLAFYPGERQHRVLADTPDLARELLFESWRQQGGSPQVHPLNHLFAVGVCLMVTAVTGWLILFHKPSAPAISKASGYSQRLALTQGPGHHRKQWAHHRAHSPHPAY